MALTEDEELELLYLEKEKRARQASNKPSLDEMKFIPENLQTTTSEAVGQGLASAVPFQNELSAVAERGMGAVGDVARKAMGEEPVYEDTSISQLADENRARKALVEDEHPLAFGLSKAAGMTALSFVPGAAEEALAARGLTTAANIANVANITKNPVIGSIAQGAVQGASEGGPDNRLSGAVLGGTVGGVTAGVFKGLTNLREIGKAMQDTAAESAAATLGLSKSEIEHVGEERLMKIGKMLQDDKVTGNPSTLATIRKEIETNFSKANERLTRMYNAMDTKIARESLPTLKEQLVNLTNKFEEGTFPDKRAGAIVLRKLKDLTSKFDPEARMSPSQLREFAQTLEDLSKKYSSSAVPAEQSATGLLQDTATQVRSQIHNLAKDMGPKFSSAFDATSAKSGMYGVAKDGITARLADRFQPTSNIHQGLKKAVSFSQPAKGLYQGGTQMVGDFTSWISKNTKTLGKFAKPLLDASMRGSASSVHYVLMQTDPDYRQRFEKASEDDARETKE